jgi:tetratricopeptide (TPR) repeat protein
MRRSIITMLVFIMIGGVGLVNFNCASADMTSARLYIQEGDLENALAALERELEANPENHEAWFLKGAVYQEMDQPEQMIESFERSIALSDEYAEDIQNIRLHSWMNYINEGIETYNLGPEDSENYRQSIEYFRLATLMQPDSTIAYRNWGFAHIVLGELEEAVIPLKMALEREEDFESAKFTGQIYFDIGYEILSSAPGRELEGEDKEKFNRAMQNAITYLTMAMEMNPEDAEVVATLSNTFIVLEREEEAMEIFRQGIETDPDNQIYHYNLGVLVMERGSFEEAIGHFENAIAIDPEYDDAYYNLGVTYVNWGVELREDALERGDDADRRYREKFEQALPHLEQALDFRPNDANLWETLGRLYANLDRVQEAEDAFKRADELQNSGR